jgi:hypothetical protein
VTLPVYYQAIERLTPVPGIIYFFRLGKERKQVKVKSRPLLQVRLLIETNCTQGSLQASYLFAISGKIKAASRSGPSQETIKRVNTRMMTGKTKC